MNEDRARHMFSRAVWAAHALARYDRASVLIVEEPG